MKRTTSLFVPLVFLLAVLTVLLPAQPARAAVPIDRDLIKQIIYPTLGYPAIIKGGEELTIEFDPRNQDWSAALPQMSEFQVSATTTNSLHPVTRTLPVEHFAVGYSARWPEYSPAAQPRAKLYLVTVDVPETLPEHLYDLTVRGKQRDGSWLTDSQPHSLQAVDEYKSDFKYAQMTDIHVWGPEASYPGSYTHERNYRHEAYSETDGYGAAYYHKTIQQMNRAKPDFIVYTGDYDFSQKWLYKQNYADFAAYRNSPWNGRYYEPHFEMDWFYAETLKLDVPVFMLLGNHDAYCRYDFLNIKLEEDYKDSWRNLFGPQYFSFDYGSDYHFSAVDSMDWSTKDRNLHWALPNVILSPGKWQGQVGAGGDAFRAGWSQEREDAINENGFTDQLLWLKRDLEAHAASKVRTVLLHHDPWKQAGSGEQYDDASMWGIVKMGGKGAGRLALIKLLRENNVALVLSGHDHSDSYGSIGWKAGGGEVKFVNTTSVMFQDGSGTGMWVYPGYRFIRVIDDQVANFYYMLADDSGGNPLQWSWPSYAGTTTGGPNNFAGLLNPAIGSAWSATPGTTETLECTITNHLTGYQFIPGGEWSGDLNGAFMEFPMPHLSGGYYYELANGEFGDIFDDQAEEFRTYAVTTDVVHAPDGATPEVKTVGLVKSTTPDTQAPTCSMFEIDGGAPATEEVIVTLTNDATDPGGSGLMDMKIWNDGQSEEDAVWQRYEAETVWEMRHLAGERTVYTRFRDRAMPGNKSDVYEASIALLGDEPAIYSVVPDHANVDTQVVISGADYGEPRTEEDRVRFNGVTADVTNWTDTSITCVVPHGVASGVVTVTTDAGSVSADFHVMPLIERVTPDYAYNNRPVHIDNLEGTGFNDHEGTPTVKLTSGITQIFASNVVVVSPQSITCDFDLDGVDVGFYSLVVQNNDGYGDALEGGFRVDFPPPEVTGITPNWGVNDGTEAITDLAGDSFRDGMRVFLANGEVEIEATDVVVVSPGKATCTLDLAGAAAGKWDVRVVNPDGKSATLPEGFEVRNPVPRIDGIDPQRALVGSPGITIEVTGESFLGSSVVRWDGSDRATTFIDGGRLAVEIPASDLNERGTFPVTVFNPSPGGGASGSIDFDVYYKAPEITSVSPAGSDGGRRVEMTVNGADFRGPNANIRVKTGPNGAWSGTTRSWTSNKVVCDINIPADGRTGTYDVVLEHQDDGKKATLKHAFTVNRSATSRWYLAEGSTAWGFDTCISIINPGDAEVEAKVTWNDTRAGGSSAAQFSDISLPPESQTTLNARDFVGDRDFSTIVESRHGEAIAVDRTMTWNGPEAHLSIGVNAPQKTWYFAEGSTNWGFETWVTVQNPNDADANVEIKYMTESNGTKTVSRAVPANSRRTYDMETDAGNCDSSIQVSSDIPVVSERAMYRNNRREGHGTVGEPQLSQDYYLAEGTTAWGFDTYLMIVNKHGSPMDVSVFYQTTNGEVPMEPFTMPSESRKTIKVNEVLPHSDCSIRVHGSKPLMAERAMYWNNGTGEACHASIGVTAPHATWFLADGSCDDGWESWTIVQNPGGKPVDVEITYLPKAKTSDSKSTRTVTIPANSRKSFAMSDDTSWSFGGGTVVRSKDPTRKIIVERAMYRDNRGAGTSTIGGFSN